MTSTLYIKNRHNHRHVALRFAGILSNSLWLLDSSTNSSNPTSPIVTFRLFAMLVLSESHYDQQVSVEDTLSVMRYASETRISLKWSGWRDLNARLLRPKRSALPSWATSRHGQGSYIIYFQMSTYLFVKLQL